MKMHLLSVAALAALASFYSPAARADNLTVPDMPNDCTVFPGLISLDKGFSVELGYLVRSQVVIRCYNHPRETFGISMVEGIGCDGEIFLEAEGSAGRDKIRAHMLQRNGKPWGYMDSCKATFTTDNTGRGRAEFMIRIDPTPNINPKQIYRKRIALSNGGHVELYMRGSEGCKINLNNGKLSFGRLSLDAQLPKSVTGSITVKCAGLVRTKQIQLSAGGELYASGMRRMLKVGNSAEYLEYQLYQGLAGNTVWGTGENKAVIDLNSDSFTYNFRAEMPKQNLNGKTNGKYRDTVIVILTYSL